MNSRERFHLTMQYDKPDRVPYFEEGIRDDVWAAWQKQGLASPADLSGRFSTDMRDEFALNIDPQPYPRRWPETLHDLGKYRQRIKLDDPRRFPADWLEQTVRLKERSHVLMLEVHHGFFLTMGVGNWDRFYEVIRQLKDEPALVHAVLDLHGELSARMTERWLQHTNVDAILLSEPIGGMNGPIIAPWTYKEFVLASYRPVLEVVRRYGVQILILRTYANARILIPELLQFGFNCLWACECESGAMDYRQIRKEFGRELRLIGGIDLDALRFGKAAIQREIEEKVPPLLESGGYIPLADGRVRADVPLENYLYYRQLLEKVTTQDHS
jgi:hypothetical protein